MLDVMHSGVLMLESVSHPRGDLVIQVWYLEHSLNMENGNSTILQPSLHHKHTHLKEEMRPNK